jgi:3-dehydroquinate synthetase
MAMCDSSIGGKTGIDSPQGKNLIGSIYQPSRVIINTGFLSTLDDRNFCNGLLEVIKMGALRNKNLFDLLENSSLEELRGNKELLRRIMELSVKGKIEIVESDLKEKGIRFILNLGHTIGHAIEAHENGTLLHGEAVAIGLRLELELMVKHKLLPSSVKE